jgi:hypothetical protein
MLTGPALRQTGHPERLETSFTTKPRHWQQTRGVIAMDQQQALKIVNALAAGADPMNGEIFPPESPLQHPDVARALFVAAAALERDHTHGKPASVKNANLPANAGLSWSKEEDAELLAGFDSGLEPKALATAHQRTLGSIRSRLIKFGKLEAGPGDRR